MTSQERQEIKAITQLFENLEKKENTIGIIIDVSGTHKSSQDQSLDFITKIKLIDEGFNYESETSEKKKYLQVQIFTKNIEDAPKIKNIGDILYIKRFKIMKDNHAQFPNLCAQTQGHYSHWRIYNGDQRDNDRDSYRQYQDNLYESNDSELDNQILANRIQTLRKFNKQYFMLKMDWYGIKNEFTDFQNNNFDLMLQFQQVNDIDDKNEFKTYQFIDSQENNYILQSKQINLNKGDFVKIRSIEKMLYIINQSVPNNLIYLKKQSSITRIPNYFYDYLNFKNLEYKFFYNQEYIQNNSDILSFQFQNNQQVYDMTTQNLSFINSKYRNLQDTQNITPLSKLLKAEESFKKTNVIPEELKKKHRILCYVFDILQDNLSDAIQLYSLKQNQIYNLKDPQVQEKKIKTYRILKMNLAVKDISIDIDPKIFQLFIFSYDKNPQNILPDIDIDSIDPFSLSQNSKYQKFVENLISQNNLNNLCEFIIEPIIHQTDVIFRVKDTIFKKL